MTAGVVNPAKTVCSCRRVLLVVLCTAIVRTTVAQSAAHGTLVVQSPVQAIASINGQGTFLVMPGTDLRWSRIAPGTYRIRLAAGNQQWERQVQVVADQTATVAATLDPPGSPLALAPAMPPPAAPVRRAAPPPPAFTRPEADPSPPSRVSTPQPKEVDPRPTQQAITRQQRAAQEAARRQRDTDSLAQRRRDQEEARHAAEQKKQEERRTRPRRPKVH